MIENQTDELAQIIRRHKHDGQETEQMNNGIITIPMSFETGEQTATTIYFPFAAEITKIRGIVMKAVAATDSGTITGANSAGSSTNGIITCAASAALNTEYSVSPSTNYRIAANGYYKLTSAKTTVGGKVLITLEYRRL